MTAEFGLAALWLAATLAALQLVLGALAVRGRGDIAGAVRPVAIVQGGLTLTGFLLGSVLPDPHIAALTATGGLMLVAIGLRLLNIKQIPVGDMLPALIVAPLLTQLVIALR